MATPFSRLSGVCHGLPQRGLIGCSRQPIQRCNIGPLGICRCPCPCLCQRGTPESTGNTGVVIMRWCSGTNNAARCAYLYLDKQCGGVGIGQATAVES